MRIHSTYMPNQIPKTWRLVFHSILLILFLLCILPVVLVYIISITSETSLKAHGYSFFPSELNLQAYQYLLRDSSQILRSFAVSVSITLLGSVGGVLVMSMYAYTISRQYFKYRMFLSYFAVFTMLFNGGIVPSYIINTSLLHLNDTLFILFLPLMINAFYIIVMRTFFRRSIPDAVIESAKLDGANEFTILFRIVIPMAKPALATIGLFLVVELWNDWFHGLLYITKPELTSLQYLLMKIQNTLEFLRSSTTISGSARVLELLQNIPTESGRMALTVFVMTPTLFAYPFFQRYFVRGLTVGAVKG